MAQPQPAARTASAPPTACDDLTEAASEAERLISRMQDIVTDAIQPDGDPKQAFEELIGELDPAPEGAALRQALGMDETGSRDLPEQTDEPPPEWPG